MRVRVVCVSLRRRISKETLLIHTQAKFSAHSITALERWTLRDQVLEAELTDLILSVPQERVTPEALGSALITWSPILPVMLDMAAAQRTLHESLSLFLARDRLFCLGVFFGIPLMDRTETLKGPIRCKILDACPTTAEVDEWRGRGKGSGDVAGGKSLELICEERADEIWHDAENRGWDVQV